MKVILGKYNTTINLGNDQHKTMIVGDRQRLEDLIAKASVNGCIYAEYGNPVIDSSNLSSQEVLKRNMQINPQNIFCVIKNVEIEEVEQTDKNIGFPIMVVKAEIDIDELPFEPSFGMRALSTKENIDDEIFNVVEHIISWDLRTDICQTTKSYVGDITMLRVNEFNLLKYKFKIALTDVSDNDYDNLTKLLLVIEELIVDEEKAEGTDELIAAIKKDLMELKDNE